MFDPYANTVPPYEAPEPAQQPPPVHQPRRAVRQVHQTSSRLTPLDRQKVRGRRHWFVLFLGVFGWASSWAATITFIMEYEAQRRGAASWNGLGAGFLVALLLTAGQIFNSDDSLIAYMFFLAPDALLTFIQGLPLVRDIVTFVLAKTADATGLAVGPKIPVFTSWALMFILAIVFSRLPERVLLGPRVQRLRDRLRRR